MYLYIILYTIYYILIYYELYIIYYIIYRHYDFIIWALAPAGIGCIFFLATVQATILWGVEEEREEDVESGKGRGEKGRGGTARIVTLENGAACTCTSRWRSNMPKTCASKKLLSV